ncbi:MAG: tRNA uridine-5-carboxymethylaminomethyl(34) synthesis enzyme MnmG [Eubacteriales bacterium]|nr:tRNA uridine-5-carboxymethylaminomethyl(34) synthesis enzyme MnmG [Eubacteriales bacterium]
MLTIEQALLRPGAYLADAYDIAVIGAGHAGCEAALAGARLGFQTILFAINLDSVGNMPCNPNIGGTAKGQLVREIDALGGEMGRAADKAMIQFRMLNQSRGPAVLSPRAQIDRRKYQSVMKQTLEQTENLDLRQSEVVEILVEPASHDPAEGPGSVLPRVSGVMTRTGAIYPCQKAILTTGTYLEGKIIIGSCQYSGGPDGMFPSIGLSDSLRGLGLDLVRFKTGTPVRLNFRTIDFSQTERQDGDAQVVPFSFEHEEDPVYTQIEQQPCYLTWTTPVTKQEVEVNLHRSPLFSGEIEGVGPRYCPSIEDKFVKFKDKERHQVFIEPMGRDTYEMYLQGMSSSMPEDVQVRMMRSLPGLSHAKIMRSAYAIEYDCLDPTGLRLTLETKAVQGLYSAGQVNGTSGYEEAAAQGLVAGINAVRSLNGQTPVVIDRSQGYIGVLIDDLVTKGTNEPYRMMTARAEYRLVLRQDNADRRLTPLGHELGLVSDARYMAYLAKQARIAAENERFRKTRVAPGEKVNSLLESLGSTPLKPGAGTSLADLLRRPEIHFDDLAPIDPDRPGLSTAERFAVEVDLKYEGYIRLEQERIDRFLRLEHRELAETIDYAAITGLRLEARQKLSRLKPASLGQASRISGVSPADIAVLLVYLDARGAPHA